MGFVLLACTSLPPPAAADRAADACTCGRSAGTAGKGAGQLLRSHIAAATQAIESCRQLFEACVKACCCSETLTHAKPHLHRRPMSTAISVFSSSLPTVCCSIRPLSSAAQEGQSTAPRPVLTPRGGNQLVVVGSSRGTTPTGLPFSCGCCRSNCSAGRAKEEGLPRSQDKGRSCQCYPAAVTQGNWLRHMRV